LAVSISLEAQKTLFIFVTGFKWYMVAGGINLTAASRVSPNSFGGTAQPVKI